ncbi:MAG: PadR family transcriptional regulator [Thermomicrobiales bacterium]
MARRKISNPLALTVLATLFERPMHPYEISSTLKYRRKEESIRLNYGSLYAVVQSLERAGFIMVVETVREGNRPERTVYAITDAGRTELHDWLGELVAVPQKEYPAFEAALSLLPVLTPDEAVALLDRRLEGIDRQLAQINAEERELDDQGFPALFRMESDFQQAMLAAERTFVAETVASIRNESLGGLDLWRFFHGLSEGTVTISEVRAELERFAGEEGRWWISQIFGQLEKTWLAREADPDAATSGPE